MPDKNPLYNTSGPRAVTEEDKDAMNAMMKARLAYAEMHGNPAANRMVSPTDNPYIFDNGYTGTHYMGSYGKYAIPNIQNVDGEFVLPDGFEDGGFASFEEVLEYNNG